MREARDVDEVDGLPVPVPLRLTRADVVLLSDARRLLSGLKLALAEHVSLPEGNDEGETITEEDGRALIEPSGDEEGDRVGSIEGNGDEEGATEPLH